MHSAGGQESTRVIDFNTHLWTVYSGDHPVSERWGLHFDGQWRRAEFGGKWQQLLLRPGVNFALTRRVQLTAGYAYIRTYPYGEFPARAAFPEHRLYQQVQVTHGWGMMRVQHRSRLEQRFVGTAGPQPRTWTYQNRFRQQVRVEAPLRDSWYLPVFNEIFIGLPPNYGARVFDQNRLFAGVGRAAGRVKVEAGYLNHFVGQRNGRVFEFNNTLLVTVSSSAALRRR